MLPTRASVQRAHRWVERRAETAVRITSYHGLQVLIVPAKAKAEADAYWRFSGEVVSSRQAQDFLDGKPREGIEVPLDRQGAHEIHRRRAGKHLRVCQRHGGGDLRAAGAARRAARARKRCNWNFPTSIA